MSKETNGNKIEKSTLGSYIGQLILYDVKI